MATGPPRITYTGSFPGPPPVVAAPPVVRPGPVVRSLSYVPPPATRAPVSPIVSMSVPTQSLEDLPNPQTIARQKDGYLKALDDEFNQGTNSLAQQIQARKQQLSDMAAQRKAEFNAQVEAQVQAQQLALDQQYNQQLMVLQQRAAQQKSVLEQQALKLTMEYQQKANMEQMARQQEEMRKQQSELMQKQAEEMQRLQVQQAQLAQEYGRITGGIPIVAAPTGPVAFPPVSPVPVATMTPPVAVPTAMMVTTPRR